MRNAHIFNEKTPCPRCQKPMYYEYVGDRCYVGPICDTCRIHVRKKDGYITEIPAEHWDEQGQCRLIIIDPFVQKIGHVDTED